MTSRGIGRILRGGGEVAAGGLILLTLPPLCAVLGGLALGHPAAFPREPEEWTAWGTIELAFATLALAVGTFRLSSLTSADLSGRHVPLIHWQDPHATVHWDLVDLVVRGQIEVALWNIGPGAARFVYGAARDSAGNAWSINSFNVPSILPAGSPPMKLRLYREPTLPHVFAQPEAAQEVLTAFRVPTAVKITLHYTDVAEGRHYVTSVEIEAHLEEGVLEHVHPPTNAGRGTLYGNLVTVAFRDSDSRSASERLSEPCSRKECVVGPR